MYYYLYYILCILILTILLFFAYVRIRFPFWCVQPVFHVYDLGYLIFPPGIIQHSLPEKNKYINFKKVNTVSFPMLSEYQTSQWIHFIQVHYLKNGDNVFIPKRENLLPYFHGHMAVSFLSFYLEPEMITDSKKGEVLEHNKIVGVITSRPVNISIWRDKKKNTMNAYYVDYLCVHRQDRKKGVAPQLIQTHHYNQRHRNQNIAVNLFKREGDLTGIVPLCVYKTYGFPVVTWVKPPELPASMALLEITPQNMVLLHDFLKKCEPMFDILIYTELSNLVELIKTKNLFVYVILSNQHEVSCAYFFKKSCVLLEKGLEILTCIGSIYDSSFPYSLDMFLHGFKISFWKIAEKNNFGFAAIENISHNHLIIHHLMKKTKPSVISPCAYFFYNFAYPTFSSTKSFILI